jgi:ABC-2 type transport system permease protein
MTNFAAMLWVETRKAWRSHMPLFTTLFALFMPLGIAFLIFVATHPGVSARLGLVTAKANLLAYSRTGWPLYLALLAQTVAAGGFFVFCFVISWVFGREFADGTVKDLLAVPVGRPIILLAKFVVAGAWSAVLAAGMLGAGLLVGALIGLPEGSPAALLAGSAAVAVTACLALLVVLPFAFFASIGRGYLLPIGLAILSVVAANLLAVLGLGSYFPWAVPALYAQGKGDLVPLSYGLALLAGLAGLLGTCAWWQYADQTR